MTNQLEVSSTQTEQIIPAFMLPIIAERDAEDAKNNEILTGLDADLMAANQDYVKVMTEHGFNHHAQPVKDALKVVGERDAAIRDFSKKLELLKNERDANDLLNIARYDLADKFGISLELLDKLVTDSKDVKNTLKSSFTALFGKPTIFAKPGATGKDVSKSNGAAASTEIVSRETSANGNPEKPGTKKFEAYNDLVSGMTFDELLTKYPWENNPGKLNGTVRSVINIYKFKLQDDKTYAIAQS